MPARSRRRGGTVFFRRTGLMNMQERSYPAACGQDGSGGGGLSVRPRGGRADIIELDGAARGHRSGRGAGGRHGARSGLPDSASRPSDCFNVFRGRSERTRSVPRRTVPGRQTPCRRVRATATAPPRRRRQTIALYRHFRPRRFEFSGSPQHENVLPWRATPILAA